MAVSDDRALLLQVGYDLATLERQQRRLLQLVGDGANQAERRMQRAFGNPNIGRALDRTFDASRMRLIDGAAARLGTAGTALGEIGPAGIVAAAGILAVAGAFNQAAGAARFANDLADAARNAHVTTDTLQELRFALEATGGQADQADEALKGFSETLGRAQGGNRRAVAVFASIGLDPRNIHDVDDGLRQVTERLQGFSQQAQDAFLGQSGLAQLAPVIRQGVTEMQRLRNEAQALGLVMDSELVQRGAEANQQFTTLAHVIDTQLKSAFVDLAPILSGLLSIVADWARVIADIADHIRQIEDRTSRTLVSRQAELTQRLTHPDFRTQGQYALHPERRDADIVELVRIDAELGRRQSATPLPPRTTPLTPTNRTLSARGRSGPTQEELIDRADLLRLQNQLNIAQEAGNADQIQYLQNAIQHLQLIKSYQDLGLSRADAMEAADTQIGRLELAQEGSAARRLAHQEGLVTATERLQPALEAIAQEEENAAYWVEESLNHQLEIARLSGDSARVRELEQQLALLQRIKELTGHGRTPDEAAAQARQEIGEEQWARTVGNIRDSVRAGLEAGVRGGWPGILEYLGDSLRKRLLDSAADAITQIATMGGKNGIGGFIASLFNLGGGGSSGPRVAGIPKHGLGSYGTAPGLSVINDNGPELVNLPGGSQIIPASGLNKLGVAGGGGGVTVIQPLYANFKGSVTTAELIGQMQAFANNAGAQAVQISLGQMQRRTQQQSMRRLGLR